MNMRGPGGLGIVVLYFALTLHAQDSFLDSKEAYLAQPRPTDTPQIFAPGLLADPGTVVMGRISFTQDGKEIYYDQEKEGYDIKSAKIKVFKYDGQKWNGPRVPLEQFADQAFSMDNNWVVFRWRECASVMEVHPHQRWMERAVNFS
jgi:hypothetical protein